MAETALAKSDNGTKDIAAVAREYLSSGYFEYLTKGKPLDQAVKDAVVIIAKGKEMGLPSLLSLQKLYVVYGQVTCAVELMIGLAARSKVVTWGVVEEDDQHCKYQVTRHDTPQPISYAAEFSLTDAKRMGLVKEGGAWQRQPRTMCRKRAASIAFREVCPDIIGGMYLFDELGVQTIPHPTDWDKEEPVIEDGEFVLDPDVVTPQDLEAEQEPPPDESATMTNEELLAFRKDLKDVCGEFDVVGKDRVHGEYQVALEGVGLDGDTNPRQLTMHQGTAVLAQVREQLTPQ